MGKPKKPSRDARIRLEVEKRPRISPAPQDENVRWRLSQIDFGGPWCPKLCAIDVLLEFHGRVSNFETMTPEELMRGTGGGTAMLKPIPIDHLAPVAKRRLDELALSPEYLHEFRVRGRPRLWAIRERSVFSILWLDPMHEVCPSTRS